MRFEIADCRGCRHHVLIKGRPCSSVDKGKMRNWGGVFGTRKKMRRKHMETKGLGGGGRGRDRMFYISSSIYSL